MFQAIVEPESGTALGYEALARFPEPPQRCDDWFDDAWRVGLGVDLELATARAAMQMLADIPAPAYLAVNFSPETLLSPLLEEILDGVDRTRLVIEITEHARVLDYAPLRDRLDELRAGGVRVAIDDVGTGHAGINHLLGFRPEILGLSAGQGFHMARPGPLLDVTGAVGRA